MHLYRFKPGRRGEAGFTLLELLVVIGIIAVLASVLLPAITKSYQGGRRAKCQANMRQLSAAYLVMVGERNGELVPSGSVGKTWYNELDSYVQLSTTSDYLRISCPGALANMKSLGYKYTVTRASYGLNNNLGDVTAAAGSVALRMASLATPSATVLLGDSGILNGKDGLNIGLSPINTTAFHGNKFAISYADGHSAFVDQTYLDSMKATKGTAGSEGSIFWNGL